MAHVELCLKAVKFGTNMITKSNRFKTLGTICILFMSISMLIYWNVDVPRAGEDRVSFGNSTKLAISNLDKRLNYQTQENKSVSPEQLLQEFGESSLRQYLTAPTLAQTAQKVAKALAMYGVERETGEILLSYIKDPREWPNANRIGSESDRLKKINLVYRLARFDSPKIVDFLLRASELGAIQAEMPLWVEFVGGNKGELPLVADLASLRGRACIALMLKKEPDYKRVVVNEYNKTLDAVRSEYHAKDRTEEEQDALVLMLTEIQCAIVVGDCVLEENVDDCMNYLDDLEGTFYGLGRYFYARYGDNTFEHIAIE